MDWKTAITEVKDGEIRIRGYLLSELLGKLNYSQMVALLLKGELPSAEENIVLDALMVAACDHGTQSPSALITRQAAAAGASLNTAVPAGMLSFSTETGMAAEACMIKLFQAIELVAENELSLEDAAMQIVTETLKAEERLPGFGTPGQEPDPVVNTLLSLVGGLDLPMAGAVQVVKALEVALAAELDQHIPINLGGAIAATLCELNYSPQVGNAFFLLGRLPGLVAHYVEEKTREESGRLIDIGRVGYDGKPPRELV